MHNWTVTLIANSTRNTLIHTYFHHFIEFSGTLSKAILPHTP